MVVLNKEDYLEKVVQYMKDDSDEVFNRIYNEIIRELTTTIHKKDIQIEQLKERIISFTER